MLIRKSYQVELPTVDFLCIFIISYWLNSINWIMSQVHVHLHVRYSAAPALVV